MISKVIIKYDGSNYYGWQHQKAQKDVITVEKVVKQAVSAINKIETDVVASGRTDRNVHAIGQVFHFDNVHNIPSDRLKFALNNALPDDVVVVDVEEVSDDFHARFSAKSKEYHYYINTKEYDIFKRNYELYYKYPLDFELMKEACALLVGKHDFTAFNTTPKSVKKNHVITIKKFDVIKDNDYIIFKIEGTSFLRHMVRMLVGAVVFVGAHKIPLSRISELLENPNGFKSPYNIEPNGLYLYKVYY